MLDIDYIKDNLEKVKKSIETRKADVDLDKLLKLDDERKELLREIEEINSKKRTIAMMGSKKAEESSIPDGKTLRYKGYELEEKLRKIEDTRKSILYQIPNLPLEGVPEGDASNNKILRQEGHPPKFDFTPKDHVELGELLDIIDIPRAAKVSGTRFGYLKNEGALLEFALVQFAFETLVKEGFIPIVPPALIRKEITDGLGYWHGRIDEEHTANENYYLVSDPEEHKQGLYLIGTGEHAVVPMHSDEVLNESELPKKYVAFSACFRREAGSYGQDTRGILRVHQFDKVEMVEFVRPEDDEKERRKMLSLAEDLMKKLGLPYQVVQLASGDLSFPGAETMDIETWIPSQGRYRETHSISTTTDFQARRLNIKYETVKYATAKVIKGPPSLSEVSAPYMPATPGVFTPERHFVHILNGTAFAIGRMIIAILENFQQADGSVRVPEVLHKYTGFSEIRPK